LRQEMYQAIIDLDKASI